LINNRQAGRRRGRGGQQQRSQGGNPGRGQDNGNRIDNRARGNAAQLLEKYKALARDAQMQGDRVNTEYYLQFADHYFRVLAETRARFEETNPSSQGQQGRRPGGANTFDEDEQDYEDEGEPIRGEQSQPQPQHQPRQQNTGNQNGNGNGYAQNGSQNGQNGGQRNGNGNGQYDDERPRRDDRERQPRQERFADDRRPQRDGNRQDGRQDARQDNRPEARQDAPRAEQQPVIAEQMPELVRTEQPEVAVAAVTPAFEAPAAEAPAAEPRRRGRPRRVVPVDAEPAPTFDAGLLPPSLTASIAPSEPAPVQDVAPAVEGDEPAEKPRRRRGRPPASTEPVQA